MQITLINCFDLFKDRTICLIGFDIICVLPRFHFAHVHKRNANIHSTSSKRNSTDYKNEEEYTTDGQMQAECNAEFL